MGIIASGIPVELLDCVIFQRKTPAMPGLTTYTKQRILQHSTNGNAVPTICKLLKEEEIFVNQVTVWKFLCHHERIGSLLYRRLK